MAPRRKTGFDEFFNEQMKAPEFAAGYEQARREIDAVDRIVRALDQARVDVGMSKAELARKISTTPDVVRRLLTEERANPTIATVVKLADVLGLRVELVPDRTASTRRIAKKKRRAA